MNKSYILSFLLFALFFLVISCGGEKSSQESSSSSTTESTESTEEASSEKEETAGTSNRRGQLIYKQYCVICHGADGKLAVSGAKDLSISTIPMEERINQITNGKGLMTPYKDILSEEQINAVALYLDELKQ